MQHNTESWMKSCPNCIIADCAIRNSGKLICSWPVSSLWVIVHMDVWQPGNATAHCSVQCFLGIMCNLSGFAVTAKFDTLNSATLASPFMKCGLLEVGFCLLIAPNDGSPFKCHFGAMCIPTHCNLHHSIVIQSLCSQSIL